jgi:purine-nucleoside phosphorylase
MRDESEKAAALIRARAGTAPVDVGVLIGSSLATLADHIANPVATRYEDLPGFMRSRLESGNAECIVGALGSARVALLKGRAHYHETGDFAGMRVPLETIRLLGAKAVVLTCAAGSVRREITPGTPIAIRDHINLTGINPLVGLDETNRAVNLSAAYDPTLRERFAKAVSASGRKSQEATLMWFPGPSFETPAEVQAARLLGADLVGMSSVPEVLIARHLGLRVLTTATVTNYAAGLSDETLGREQAMRVSAAAAATLVRVLVKLFDMWVLDVRTPGIAAARS